MSLRCEAKVVDRAQLAARLKTARADGRRVAVTNGCFDILHPGHVTVLEAAKAEADLLVVALNTDTSVKRLKGAGRPVVEQEKRAIMMAAMEAVDFVTFFDEDTPFEIINELRPDVLVKGGDWGPGQIVGEPEVLGWGGKVLRVDLEEGQSTSALIAAIIASEQND